MWAAGRMQCCQQIITFQPKKHTILVLLLIAINVFHVNGERESCGFGTNTPGITVPIGDILIQHGNPLEIFCKLYENYTTGFNASDLFFSRGSEVISSEFTNVVNETTLRLYIPNPAPSSSMYLCKLRNVSKEHGKEVTTERAVCLNLVYVGVRPQDVEHFGCVSQNWENLTCKWDVPTNYVPTTYKLFCHLGAAGSLFNRRCKCPNDTDVKHNYCFWSSATDPQYRKVLQKYVFTIEAENYFGKEYFDHTIDHWAYVIPARPNDLSVPEVTSYSALLTWSVEYPMNNFEPGLSVKIEYRSEHDSINTWLLANTANMTITKVASYNLTGLKYANTAYEARVYMKSSVAVDEGYWSEPATKVIRTKPTVPGAAPRTDVGSFEINNQNGHVVYVYWQSIDSLLKNGDTFTYKVLDVKVNGVSKPVSPVEITNAYAKFIGLSKTSSYNFTIVSSNAIGRSVGYSNVFVPSEDEIPPQPVSFTKIAFQNRTFELSWKQPTAAESIKDYTIFWCENGQDRPYQCTGFLDWRHVPKSETVFSLVVPKNSTYQFAISANGKTSSSGMVWASCTVIHNQGVRKMKNVWTTYTNATFIGLVWNLDCSERMGMVKGFRVYYCPTLSPYEDQCKGEEKNDTVDYNPKAGNYTVRYLKPYTTYMLSIAVINSKMVEGPRSDYLYATTMESAPDPVQNISITKVTNTSMVVSWVPPVNTNGKIKYYEVSYNGRSKKVDNGMETTLSDLIPFVNYTVGVTACTVNCSGMVSITMQTKIGNPGEVDMPRVTITNTSMAYVNWDPPLQPGGFIDYYNVTIMSERQSVEPTYFNTTETDLLVGIDCSNNGFGQKYLFSVRAVNKDGNVLYAGPWSQKGEGNCVTLEMSEALIVFISLCGLMATGAACFGAFYAARRVWGHYNEMRHVKVTLPPGLTSVNVYCPTSYSY